MKNVTITTTAQRVVTEGYHPVELVNQGSAVIELEYDGGDGTLLASVEGRKLYSKQSWSPDRKQFNHAIYAKVASGTGTLHIQGET